MDHLSSCYFCGTAIEGSAGEYRVVPVELRETDDVTTTTLCSSCHRKLERLLEPVVATSGATSVTLDTVESGRQSERAGSDATASRSDDANAEPDAGGADTATDDDTADDGSDPLVDVEARLGDAGDSLEGDQTGADEGASEAETGGDETGE
jgi:hypothetical protein